MCGEIWLDSELFGTMRSYCSSFSYVFAADLTHLDRLNITDDVRRDLDRIRHDLAIYAEIRRYFKTYKRCGNAPRRMQRFRKTYVTNWKY